LAAAQTKPSAAEEKIGWSDRELKIKIGETTSSFFFTASATTAAFAD